MVKWFVLWIRYLAIIKWGWVGYEEFYRSRITPSEICRILHVIRKPNSIIMLYYSCKVISSLKLVNSTRGHFSLCWMTQPCAQVFSVNGSIIFDVNDSLICSGLHFWRQWFNNLQWAPLLTSLVQYDRILGQQKLFMVNYACGFNQLEMGKYFEWIIVSNYWMRLSRIWRILQIEVDNTLWDLQNSSYPTKAEFSNCFIIHSKYYLRSNL